MGTNYEPCNNLKRTKSFWLSDEFDEMYIQYKISVSVHKCSYICPKLWLQRLKSNTWHNRD